MPKYQKGQSGNPSGRPKGSTSYKQLVQQSFVDIMESKMQVGKQTIPYYQAFLENLKIAALKPDSKAFQFMAERLLTQDVLEDIDNRLNRSKREDEDFLTYRILKGCHDYQQRVLLTKESLILLLAGRRAGKSEADAHKVVQTSLTPNSLSVIIGLTFNRCLDIFWTLVLDILEDLGQEIVEKPRSEGRIKLGNGSEIHFKGNSTVDDREKLRGSKWDLVVIDEAQSQKALQNFIDEIIEPTLMDRKGQLILSGTGPKVRGTYWERVWTDTEKFKALRLNWNISDNPFIKDYKTQLEEVKQKKGLTDSSPIFIREYLGKICYDDDALVYRLNDDNFFTMPQLKAWIASQPVTDVHFSGGIDYGFNDADGVSIVCYSDTKPEIFLIYEYKQNRTGVTELVDACKRGVEFVEANFPEVANRHFYYFADTGGAGKKISYELATQYGLQVLDAYKASKDFAVELLQEQVRKRTFKVLKGGVFEDEALKTIFKRDEDDNLTRIIDDEAYHPDGLDATLYALRPIDLFRKGPEV